MDDAIEPLLAALRADEEAAERQPDPGGEAAELKERVEALERRLAEAAYAGPDGQAAPSPEAALFLQTKIELLEKKLEAAQEEALRASVLLRERDELQRQARREVEDLFRSIREQQRAAAYDGKLREQFGLARERLRALEERLALAELRAIPAEEVLGFLESEEGREELKRRLREQLARVQEQTAPPQPPLPPPPSLAARPAPPPADNEPAPSTMAVLLGRISDLERRLLESEQRREKERRERLRWEAGVLEGLKGARARWERSGGPELLAEATMQAMTDSVGERDALQAEIARLLDAIRDEPPGSEKLPELQRALEDGRRRIAELQQTIDQQLSIIQAWVDRNKEDN